MFDVWPKACNVHYIGPLTNVASPQIDFLQMAEAGLQLFDVVFGWKPQTIAPMELKMYFLFEIRLKIDRSCGCCTVVVLGDLR